MPRDNEKQIMRREENTEIVKSKYLNGEIADPRQSLAQRLYDIRYLFIREGSRVFPSIIKSSDLKHPVVKEALNYIDAGYTPKEGDCERIHEEIEFLSTLTETEKKTYFETQLQERIERFRHFVEQSIEKHNIEDVTEKRILRIGLMSICEDPGGDFKRDFEQSTGYALLGVIDYDYPKTDDLQERRETNIRDWEEFKEKFSRDIE